MFSFSDTMINEQHWSWLLVGGAESGCSGLTIAHQVCCFSGIFPPQIISFLSLFAVSACG